MQDHHQDAVVVKTKTFHYARVPRVDKTLGIVNNIHRLGSYLCLPVGSKIKA